MKALNFVYRGIEVTDEWPAGARFPGSVTRQQSLRQEPGTERYTAELPTGEVLVARSQQSIRNQIREALN